MTLRVLAACLWAAIMISPAAADPKGFEQYANGAMIVYSKFKEPSKVESERFFAFIKDKWSAQGCSSNCSTDGEIAGKQYATTMKVEFDEIQ